MAKTKENEGSVLEATSIQVAREDTSGVMIGGQLFAVKQQVNVPTLKQESGQTVAFQIVAQIREEVNYITEEVIVNGEKVKATKENIINVVRVIQIADGKTYEYVCNAMTADNLRSTYPDHSYVGLYFAVHKGETVPGKRYKETSIVELELNPA